MTCSEAQLISNGDRASICFRSFLTHCGRVTQISVFTLQLCKTDDANLRFNTRLVSTHYTLNYAIHGAFLRMVPLTDIYRRVRNLIVANIYLQLMQNRYMILSFTVLQCSHQHCVHLVASDVKVVGYL